MRCLLCLTVRTEDVKNLMSNHVFDCLACRFEILARVKVIGMLSKVLADIARHSKADIGVDIDLADSELCSFTKLIFRNADSIGHMTAVGIDHLDISGDCGETR